MTGALMKLPFLQLLSALPLLIVALNLMAEREEEAHLAYDPDEGIAAAAGLIIVSDAVMSLDNVMALGAVSGGSFWLLAFGLLLTIPLIVFGSFGFSRLMRAFPLLVDLGGALLGWVAGGMIAGDPVFAGFVQSQSPALAFTLPLACAIFVVIHGRWLRQGAPRQARPAPQRPAPQTVAPIQAPVIEAPLVEAPVAVAPAPDLVKPVENEDESASAGDRWMLLGLVALFLFFGLFLSIAVFATE